MPWIMKTATLLSFTALYFTSVVEGEDKDSKADCADLNNTTWQEYRQGAKLQVQYLLLTRKNLDCAAIFSHDSLNNAQQQSLFNASLPTKIIIHGYRALGKKPSWVESLAQALLRAEDANVVLVDWVYGASFAYNLVVQNYKEVAVQISVLINQLQNHGCKLEDFHFIGVSLGAHVSGFVGTLFEGKLGRITGLDPAGPMFKGKDSSDRLDPSDALFVEAIHTDSDNFGISIPVGHVDFFLNGGKDQAGCARSRFASVYGYVLCDHMRAIHVYISVLNSSCPLTGIPCSNYEDFLSGRCLDCRGVLNGTCPRIGLLQNSGITVSPPQEQKLFLLTTSAAPFCAHHILVEFQVSPLGKSAEVELALRTLGYPGTEQRLRLQTQETRYRRVIAHPVPLCEIHSIRLKSTGFRFLRQGDVHFVSVCISEFPYGRMQPLCVKDFNIGRSSPWSHDFVQVCGSD